MDKKILIIDESKSCIEKLTILFEEHTSFATNVTSNYDEAIAFFDKNTYENIIIDHNCKTANPFMDYILEKKPEQKVILLSDTLDCPLSCEDCLHSFKFVRLLKPINFKEILKFVSAEYIFECPNKFRFEKVDTLEKLFDFIHLDNNFFYKEKELIEDKILIKPISSESINFGELSKIEAFISLEYFTFKVQEDFMVEVMIKNS